VSSFKELIKQQNGNKKIRKAFMSFYKSFLTKLSGIFYDDTKKMGITVLPEPGKKINDSVIAYSDNYIIEGFVDGGPYEVFKNAVNKLDKSKSHAINRDDVLTDKFYFYLYLPIDSKIGILMVQKKDNSSLRRIIVPFFESLFKINGKKKCSIQSFFPKSFINSFKDNSVVKNMSFEKECAVSVLSAENAVIEEEKYDIKIVISPTANEDFSSIGNIFNKIKGHFKLLVDNNTFDLDSFEKKKCGIKNVEENKSLTFTMDEEDTIHPVINIDNRVDVDANGNYNRTQLKALCDEILNDIKPDVYAVI